MVPLLAACAAGAPQWDKPGTARAAMDEDVQKCRIEARRAAEPGLRGPTALTSADPLIDRGQERDAQEAQAVTSCMEGRGYRLQR